MDHINEESQNGLASRFKFAVEKAGGLTQASDKTGIPKRTLTNYQSGRNEPQVSALVAIAEAAGLSIQWLATGEGPRDAAEAAASNVPPELFSAAQEQAQSTRSPPALDPLLVGDIVSTYEDAVALGLRQRLSPRDVGRLVIELHQEVLERRAQGEAYSVNEFFHRVRQWPDVAQPWASDCTGSPRVA